MKGRVADPVRPIRGTLWVPPAVPRPAQQAFAGTPGCLETGHTIDGLGPDRPPFCGRGLAITTKTDRGGGDGSSGKDSCGSLMDLPSVRVNFQRRLRGVVASGTAGRIGPVLPRCPESSSLRSPSSKKPPLTPVNRREKLSPTGYWLVGRPRLPPMSGCLAGFSSSCHGNQPCGARRPREGCARNSSGLGVRVYNRRGRLLLSSGHGPPGNVR
jgi:hypothetical protein